MTIEITMKINGAEVTLDEARALYDELHNLFGKQITWPGDGAAKLVARGREDAQAYAGHAYRAAIQAAEAKFADIQRKQAP